jgi:hypothetical protein
MADGLEEYLVWHGPAHDEERPCDDTCECLGKPLNDAANAAVDYVRQQAALCPEGGVEALRQLVEKWRARRKGHIDFAHFRDSPYDELRHDARVKAMSMMPIRSEFWYSVREHGEERYHHRSVFGDPRDLAAEAADDYWANHDGWESAWPLTFVIYESEDGPVLAAFEVSMETVPQFCVERKVPGVDGGRREMPTPDMPANPKPQQTDEKS